MVTIKDVAQDAGVAVGTVSKVLNGQYVSEKNRIKVEASVKKLGYQMNFYARGLKTKNTYTVAALVPEILNPFFAEWVYYIEQELYKNGYKLLLCNTRECLRRKNIIIVWQSRIKWMALSVLHIRMLSHMYRKIFLLSLWTDIFTKK